MSEVQPGASGTTQSVSDQAEAQVSETTLEETPSKDMVKYESYKKVLSEKKRAQEKLQEMEARLKEIEEAKLKEKEDWKAIAELKEKELASERSARLEKEAQIQQSLKLSSFLKKIGATVEDKYWDLIDLDAVTINPDTGLPDELSVEKAAKSFAEKFPEILVRPGPKKVPTEAPSTIGDEPNMSVSEIARKIAMLKRQN